VWISNFGHDFGHIVHIKFVKISTYFLYMRFRLTLYIYVSLKTIGFFEVLSQSILTMHLLLPQAIIITLSVGITILYYIYMI